MRKLYPALYFQPATALAYIDCIATVLYLGITFYWAPFILQKAAELGLLTAGFLSSVQETASLTIC